MTEATEYPKVYLYRRIVEAKLFIDKNFSQDINLDNISNESCFSKFHFIRLFKKAYGKTPHRYLTDVRVENAKQLLAENITVSKVCFSVGFNSITSFTGLFKKATGLTPSSFQKNQLLIQSEIQKAPLKFIPHCFAEAKG
jgi:AraC-like DNA-binding protein